MMEQCPYCDSYNEAAATFCSQCGKLLDYPGRRRSRWSRAFAKALIIIGILVGSMGAVVYIAFLAEPESRETPVRPTPRR